MPTSSEPGSTGLPSSVNTWTRSPSWNLAVSGAWPGTATEPPRPTASVDPKESNRTIEGWCFRRPSLTSWLHITPEEEMSLRLDRSYLPGLESSSASMGLAKASPTMATALICPSWIVCHSSAGSKRRDCSVVIDPPRPMVTNEDHWPVPCMRGQAASMRGPAAPSRTEEGGELAVEPDRLGVGVVEEVGDLLGPVAVVGVDGDEAGLEGGHVGLQVLRAVVEVGGELGLPGQAGVEQIGGQPVGPAVELAPGDDPFTLELARGVGHLGCHCFPHVGEVPIPHRAPFCPGRHRTHTPGSGPGAPACTPGMISRVTRAAFPGLPDSPVGHRIRWYVERLGDPEPPSEDELAANFEPSAKVFAPPLRDRRAWRGLAEQAGGPMEATVAGRAGTEVDLAGTTPEGRRWRYRFAVDPATTRLVELIIEWIAEEVVRVRLATEADGPALADIERRSPLVLGDSLLTIDRGDDYFAASRLMEDVGVALAELDGVPGAVQCAAAHTAHVGGRPVRMAYFHHLRILPEHQRKGLFQKLGQPLSDRYMPPHVDGTYAYVFPDNAASQRLFSFARSWPVQPVMCELPVGRLRGPPAGRPAQPADADTIVDILNTCHGGEEMFCPYSP